MRLLDILKKVQKKAGITGRLRIHDLRHTCASLLIDQGVNPRVIMHQLGHSTIRVTMDVYGHLLEDSRAAAASAMTQVFSQINPAGVKMGVSATGAGDEGAANAASKATES